jgi:CRP-like cAMP-binding protein
MMEHLEYTAKKRSKILEKTQWSDDFERRQIETLAGHMDCYRVPKGTIIFEESANQAHMCLVIEGQIQVMKSDASGSERVLSTLEIGETLGEMSLIDGEPRSASAVAASDTLLMVMTRSQFSDLCDSDPPLGLLLLMRLSKLLCQRLRETSRRLTELLA